MEDQEIPGTPEGVIQEAGRQSEPSGYIDIEMRRRVGKRKAAGLPCEMGPDFPGCLIWIRPWTSRPIQIFREVHDKILRAKYPKLKENEKLPPEAQIELSRATAVMSITGHAGTHKIPSTGELKIFKGPTFEDGETVRDFFSAYYLPAYDEKKPDAVMDMDFLELLLSLNSGVSNEAYEKIDRLGEAYVFGRSQQVAFADSNR